MTKPVCASDVVSTCAVDKLDRGITATAHSISPSVICSVGYGSPLLSTKYGGGPTGHSGWLIRSQTESDPVALPRGESFTPCFTGCVRSCSGRPLMYAPCG